MRNALHDAVRRWATTAAVAAALAMGGPLSAASLRITSPPPGRWFFGKDAGGGG